MEQKNKTIESFVYDRNLTKKLFTAGPASLLTENITGLMPCFGRNDNEYAILEEKVLNQISEITGQKKIVRLQGSSSLALEIISLNFLYGKVLLISTGYYSDRLKFLAESAKRQVGAIKEIMLVGWEYFKEITGDFDWVVACSVETSCGLKIDIEEISKHSKKLGAKLMLDATASVGLEDGHEYASVIGFSSCKGLFGLTGGSFIGYNENPTQKVDSFYLDISTHIDKRMTGPYHTIASLANVLPKHDFFKAAVTINKEKFLKDFKKWIVHPINYQPKLCTYVECKIESSSSKAVLYKPRNNLKGSVVCHLGEVHLGNKAEGKIQELLKPTEL